MSKQQVSLRLRGPPGGVAQAPARLLPAPSRRVGLLLFLLLLVREAVAGPLGGGALQAPVALGGGPADAADDDARGGGGAAAVRQEDIGVVLRLLRVAEQEAVAGAQRVEGGLGGGAALGLHVCKGG